MASVAKRAPKLIFAAIFLAFGLIGWVARATLAQDAKKDSAPPQATSDPAPPALQELPATASEAVKPPPLVNAAELPLQASAPDADFPGPQLLGSKSAKAEPPAPSKEPAPVANTLVESAADDPEKSALAFFAQNQKMAESQLKNLKAEEAKLRDRLRKVEAGIKRWESLLGALKQTQGSVVIVGPGNQGNWKQAGPEEAEPQHLEPIPLPKPTLKSIGVKK